ncbi:RNA-binding RNA processing protein rpp1, variant 2 [Entomophthora muscae]|uniref:RNA-binding RNA processing protein rpp1, variant 2 n=1 Tax=Entomophthora muscae TaxID=34485 RepID=A0ACC2TAU6_9FUNG|nr:RNA-binding RNA processing protein rpp1, variant 2 [Entomophthora muscae]
MFCDLSIVYQPDAAVMAKMLARARAAGYDVVAIDHIVTERLTPKHVNPIPKLLEDISKLKLTGVNTSFTVSDPLSDILGGEREGEAIASTVGAGGIISRGWSGTGGLKVLSRLTLMLNDITMGQCINSCPEATNQYDIVAVQPSNEATLNQAMSSLSIDLIAFDLTKAIPRAFKHQTVQPAKERGIYFEIPYAPAIHGNSCSFFHFTFKLIS